MSSYFMNCDDTYSEEFKIKELERLTGIEDHRSKWNHYIYNGIPVPRVSEIIKYCFGNKDSIIKWASSLGHKYINTRDTILDTGTSTHELIEEALRIGIDNSDAIDFNSYNRGNKSHIHTAFDNFIYFCNYIKSFGYEYEVLEIEKEVVCPLYGGTIDCIMRIKDNNGRSLNYIIDFKTSKFIAPEYLLQTMLYQYAENNYHIDGIGIVRLDKYFKPVYDFILINIFDDTTMMMDLYKDAGAMVNWYYHQISLEHELEQFKQEFRKEMGITNGKK